MGAISFADGRDPLVFSSDLFWRVVSRSLEHATDVPTTDALECAEAVQAVTLELYPPNLQVTVAAAVAMAAAELATERAIGVDSESDPELTLLRDIVRELAP